MERTLLIVKPDAVKRRLVGEVIKRVEETGFSILDIRFVKLSQKDAESLYEVHRGKSFYNDLLKFITSGPIVALLLEREDAISKMREVVGATNPANAEKGTIRGDLGGNIEQNVVHASDSKESAAREIPIFFSNL